MLRLTAACLLLPVLGVAAAPWRFSSGETRTHFVELYSSEGCSSCPPAESWFGGLVDEAGLWRDFVPVAFHVTYWDRLGWKDRFAHREFTDRQYAYASRWGRDTVYTPGLVIDGAEWKSAFGRRLPPPSVDRAGVLSVEYAEDGVCHVGYAGAVDYEAHAAILGGGIVSPVRTGENGGRTLRHEFVVLVVKSAPSTAGAVEFMLPKPAVPGVARHALAVWVTRRGGLEPLQGTGGWLD